MKNVTGFSIILITGITILQAPPASGQQNSQPRPQRPQGQSPASRPRPKSAAPQTYSEDQVRDGEVRFGAQCGFCHGKDAAGGESGPDLTRSELIAQDSHGDKAGPVIRAGRPSAGMPAFSSLSADDLNVIVAFLHSQMDKFAQLGGGRRSVDPEDLATGNAAAGREYFNGEGKCSSCHSATGDLAGIGKRLQGLNLLRRFLYPSGNRGSNPSRATFLLASGQTVVAPVVAEDEFSVTVLDPLGARQTYQKSAVNVKIDDPLLAHFEQLGKYTDTDMHNVYTYLETLK
ncbi:MAG TPA: c-type cytochrome [Bryobacteraceae bacterium]|nr:c-type cytochrome [Bryobacteraceae bacterium]